MSSNIHLGWSRLVLATMARSGVRALVLSPGSRSTPLALAAAGSGLAVHVVLDERTAGFVALGIARAKGAPVALLCTSGSALAHYGPAVLEAAQSYLPLLLLTADRPWDAYDAHAPQTVDQVKHFGASVRHYAELGLPEADPAVLRSAARVVAQCVATSLAPTPGPVHLNARFRKPLEPVEVAGEEPWEAPLRALLERGPTRVLPSRSAVDEDSLREVAEALCAARRPWLLAGPWTHAYPDAELSRRVRSLAARGGMALWAEATSGLGEAQPSSAALELQHAEQLARAPGWWDAQGPDFVLQLGLPSVGMGVSAQLARRPAAHHVVLAPHGWPDPLGTATHLLRADPREVLARLESMLPEVSAGRRAWLSRLREEESLAASAWSAAVEPSERLDEGAVVRAVRSALPEGAWLHVGNSNPVRDLDLFGASARRAPLRVSHQRGASGIDGLVAGALGLCLAEPESPVLCLLGDVSLLHDLGSLHLAGRLAPRLCVLVVNNDGGRIFEQLPLARREELREPFRSFFLTPQGTHFGAAAQHAGARYVLARSARALEGALASWVSEGGLLLLEAEVLPQDATARRSAGLAAVAAALKGARG